jgi:hypothetical protein
MSGANECRRLWRLYVALKRRSSTVLRVLVVLYV